MKKIIIIMCICLLLISPKQIYSIQTNYQISSPPIPWYEFRNGQKDLKISATGMSITGTVDSPNQPEAGGDISIIGGSGGGFYRYAFRDEFAVDAGGTVLWAGGDVGNSATMDMRMVYIPIGLEYLAMRTDNVAVIIFGGMNFSWISVGIDVDTGTEKGSVDIWTNTRGPQGGIQAAFKLTDFVFTPFFMATRLSGTATIDYEGGGESGSTTTGIPPSTSLTYGLDLIYVPIDITLSFIIQQSLSNSDNNGLRTHIVTLSYHFDLTDETNEVIEPVKIKKTKPVKQYDKKKQNEQEAQKKQK